MLGHAPLFASIAKFVLARLAGIFPHEQCVTMVGATGVDGILAH